jgi:hypothetical protein
MIRIIRNLGIIALLPLFGLVFWAAATAASSILGVDVIGVNVHGLGLASYASEITARPAPLSLQILQDAERDATANRGATAFTPAITPANGATPTPAPAPTRAPSLPPVPLPSILPVPSILPSLLPGVIR